ncbi:MAG: CAP domain-containing protein [Planctomycetes bacterium]|nr:CAP domain-containing protein [Planctomycetota bacterium]MCD7897818.1 CAP domain-containing protein [Planctomycetaceae bacterium]
MKTSGHALVFRSLPFLVLPLVALAAGCLQQGEASPVTYQDSAVKGVAVKPVRSNRDAEEAHRLVNDQRARRGMQPLMRRADLDAVAYAHARDLMRMNRLSHMSSDGRQLEDRLARLDWEWAGENLARNKGFASPAAEAVKGWIASPKHYENMFRPDYSQTGMAALYDPDGGFTYFVQIFIIPAH